MRNRMHLATKDQERKDLEIKIRERKMNEQKTIKALINVVKKNSEPKEASWLFSRKLVEINNSNKLVLTEKGNKILNDYGYIF